MTSMSPGSDTIVAARRPGSCPADLPDVSPLEACGLTVSRGRTAIFRGLDLAVARGETVVLLGPNGAGKTTLFHCLAGLLRPCAGEVRWFGEVTTRATSNRRRLGFLGHESGVYLSLTARENLLFAGRMVGLDQVHDRVVEMLSAFQLTVHAKRPAGVLSRGVRQRLAIARAVLHAPAILLLDEPFAGLDASGSDLLVEYLLEARRRGVAVLLTSHDVGQSMELADRMLWLQGGRLAPFRQGTPLTLPSPPDAGGEGRVRGEE
jgi:heme ABC exporter ATP-binding subunit CcmA